MNEQHGHAAHLQICGIKSINTSRDLNLQLLFLYDVKWLFWWIWRENMDTTPSVPRQWQYICCYILIHIFLNILFPYSLVDAFICSAKATRK